MWLSFTPADGRKAAWNLCVAAAGGCGTRGAAHAPSNADGPHDTAAAANSQSGAWPERCPVAFFHAGVLPS